MPQRNYSKKQTKVTKKNKRITLPVTLDAYNELRQDAAAFRHWLDGMIEFYPELFPAEIVNGYILHDVLPASVKLGFCFLAWLVLIDHCPQRGVALYGRLDG